MRIFEFTPKLLSVNDHFTKFFIKLVKKLRFHISDI